VSLPFKDLEPRYSGLMIVQEPAQKTTNVVGVIEKFEWAGGRGGALKVDFYVSQQNATNIKAIQQQGLKTTAVKKLAWWICDYDKESKRWFEQSYPSSDLSISGILSPKENPELDVDLTPVPVQDGIDVNVYKIAMSVAPAADKPYQLYFANSSEKKVVNDWGLKVGGPSP